MSAPTASQREDNENEIESIIRDIIILESLIDEAIGQRKPLLVLACLRNAVQQQSLRVMHLSHSHLES
jgi:hypothetical protein